MLWHNAVAIFSNDSSSIELPHIIIPFILDSDNALAIIWHSSSDIGFCDIFNSLMLEFAITCATILNELVDSSQSPVFNYILSDSLANPLCAITILHSSSKFLSSMGVLSLYSCLSVGILLNAWYKLMLMSSDSFCPAALQSYTNQFYLTY